METKQIIDQKNINQGGSYYKADWKKLSWRIGVIAVVIMLPVAGWWFFGKNGGRNNPTKVYDVAVVYKDQIQEDPEEDRRSSLKAGDVVLARETGRPWSKNEKISYLIIKMKIRESQAEKLIEPEIRELSEEEAKEKGLISDEDLEILEKEELEDQLEETIRARKYRIKIEEMGFDPADVRNKQPFEDQEFGWEIVERK